MIDDAAASPRASTLNESTFLRWVKRADERGFKKNRRHLGRQKALIFPLAGWPVGGRGHAPHPARMCALVFSVAIKLSKAFRRAGNVRAVSHHARISGLLF